MFQRGERKRRWRGDFRNEAGSRRIGSLADDRDSAVESLATEFASDAGTVT
ncbi:MAG: hypothetical protein ABI114_08610 [Rhodanobacter sp.]